jgi:superfamily I DNA and/or RNA helicase
MLSCWAVTSLATRGRVPFEPSFFDLVVIDEASQCDIASALPLLFRAKAAVIIGDPKQLRHISAIPPRRDRELLHKHDLADGYAKWAYSENSLFDLASPLAGQDDIIMLRDHHRSHADIIEFSNQHFYEGRLRIATKYDRLRAPAPDVPTVRWVPVQGVVVRPGTGALNEIEAKAVVKELEWLGIQQGYSGTVGVVTPFRAQANRIRGLVNAHPHANLLLNGLELLIDTVHKFQGDERDVMIFSPVVSKGIADGAVGFLKKTDNLFNVAITRARAALIVVGDPVAAKSAGVTYLAAFANYVENHGQNPRQQAVRTKHTPDPITPRSQNRSWSQTGSASFTATCGRPDYAQSPNMPRKSSCWTSPCSTRAESLTSKSMVSGITGTGTANCFGATNSATCA